MILGLVPRLRQLCALRGGLGIVAVRALLPAGKTKVMSALKACVNRFQREP